ncbi:hypothetical protein PHK61_26650 [Actinomycetospora lutea]|uniref:hypothetical protein n=1 Tax=Actinomycetospora lutea TaxID=663604 RepID=UPI002366DC9D|nr:hypothetical protein [Actinomycetospora lutea]MDD7942001.1 hypothetical protein [Actinomycetospora lutea]
MTAAVPARRVDARVLRVAVPAGVLVTLAAVGLGAAAAVAPLPLVGGLVVLALGVAVAAHPPLAAYLLIGLTPLVAGIDRGRLVPGLRPNEALLVLCTGALLARGVWQLRAGWRPGLRADPVLAALVAMAVANSVVPLLWMAIRHVTITGDDLSYAVVLWKLVLLYVVVRSVVRTDREGVRCLAISLGVAGLVAVIAILQSLQLFGVDDLVASIFAPFGDTSVVTASRGSATLGLAAATADLMIFNLALAAGWWARHGMRPRLLAGLLALLALGTLSSGQFSAAIGLVVALVAVGVAFRRADVSLALAGLGLGAALALAPVVATRLVAFDGATGLPESWVGRLDNLRGYFWPRLLEDHNYVLGVQPSARVPSPDTLALPYIWIESGYTWLFWGGGIPLAVAFVVFVVVAARRGLAAARGPGARGVAGTGAFVGIVVVAVLMLFDPHLTYRGSGDLLIALLALVAALDGVRVPSDRPSDRPEAGVPASTTSTEAIP